MTLSMLPPVILPLLFLLGAAFSRTRAGWGAAQILSLTALLLALAMTGMALAGTWRGIGPEPDAAFPVLSVAMTLLVTFIGFVILRYSRNYLIGEANGRYLGTLQVTLAAVTAVVLTDHLLVLLVGWIIISLGLHHLLLFYPNRLRAVVAAHKKFLFARLAEALLLIAVVLLYAHHGTWQISEIVSRYPSASLSVAEQLAALLIAATALIKCAQLPMHGWLIQVVEAPTPVSALLHAGIVNLGGYLLILFGPLLMQATAAQWLVLLVAGVTAVVAALVMSTRISIKVRLAWSTCAQMAVMLIECALGLFELALLHLIAHSCYKAYGFLAAGSAVDAYVTQQLSPSAPPSLRSWLTAMFVAAPIGLAGWWLLPGEGPVSPWLLLVAALTVVLAERASTWHRPRLAAATALAAAIAGLYGLQKFGAGLLITGAAPSAGWPADAWVAFLVLMLFTLHMILRLKPARLPAHRLSAFLFGGLYLDEWVTRTTLRLWPARLPDREPIHPFNPSGDVMP